MNFKLFGKKGGSYCIDIDDATAKRKEDEYYTLHEARDAESMLEWLLSEYRPLPKEATIRIIEKILRNEDKYFNGLEDYMIETKTYRLPRFERLDGNVLALQNRMPVIRFVVGDEYFSIKAFEEYKNAMWNIRKAMRNSLYPFSIIANMRYGYDGWEEIDYPIVYKWAEPSPIQVFDVDESGRQTSKGVTYGWLYWNWQGRPSKYIDVHGNEYTTDPESRNPLPCCKIDDFEANSINYFDRTKVRTEIDG